MADKKAASTKSPGSERWKLYETKGDSSVMRKNKTCPKCGPGFFLAKHDNRETCGHCGYTEFGSRKK